MLAWASLLLAVSLSGQVPEPIGTIEGIVVNASRDDSPVSDAEVILQVQIDGQFTAVEKTATDSGGRFQFDSLPVGNGLVYLPGANRDGVHYPGRRIQMTARRPTGYVTLAVHDAVSEPSPLVVRAHEIVMRGEPGVLHVVEGVLVDNPGKTTYVGRAADGQLAPVTLRLGIPSDFARLTFAEEFFGRNFRAIDGQVVTDIPWTPGQRWLRYTYSIPHNGAYRVWERTLETPCEHLRIRVQHERPEEISSNLPAADGAPGEAVFESAGGTLPAGHVVRMTLGHLPRPWTFYARWSALAVLLGSVLVVAALQWPRPSRREKPEMSRAERRAEGSGGNPPRTLNGPKRVQKKSRRGVSAGP